MFGAMLAGGAVLGGMNMLGQSLANAENAAQAEKNRIFQGEQAGLQREWAGQQALADRKWRDHAMKNQIQWQMNDLRRAGLNPMLALTKGAPTSPGGAVPSGASASATAPARAGSITQGATASALQAVRNAKELKMMNSQIQVNEALKTKTYNEANFARAKDVQTQLDNMVTKLNMPAIKSQAEADKVISEFNKTNAYSDSVLRRIRSFIPFTGHGVIDDRVNKVQWRK